MDIKIRNKTIMTISQEDIKCLENDLLGIEDWIAKAIEGKINNCKKRMINQWIPRLRSKGEEIPSEDSALVDKITKHKDYKNRKKRDEESEPQ